MGSKKMQWTLVAYKNQHSDMKRPAKPKKRRTAEIRHFEGGGGE